MLAECTPDHAIYFTDGSGIERQVGTAAVLHGHTWTAQRWLGPYIESNVYAAELYGIYLALDHAAQGTAKLVTVFANSQAALRSYARPSSQLGQ